MLCTEMLGAIAALAYQCHRECRPSSPFSKDRPLKTMHACIVSHIESFGMCINQDLVASQGAERCRFQGNDPSQCTGRASNSLPWESETPLAVLAAVAGNLQLRTGSEAAALSFGLLEKQLEVAPLAQLHVGASPVLDGLLDTFQVALEILK